MRSLVPLVVLALVAGAGLPLALGDSGHGHGHGDEDDEDEARPAARPAKMALLDVDQGQTLAKGLTLTFTVRNIGDGRAAGVHLDGQLPGHATWKVVDNGCQQLGTWVRCDLGDIPAGGKRTVTVVSPLGDLPARTMVAQAWTAPAKA